MRAIVLPAFDAGPAQRDDLPEPTAGDGEIVVRVQASSANPVDNAIAAGMLKGMAEYRFPVVLGRDFAGVVEQAGAGVTTFAEGDEVYGLVPHMGPDVHAGAWAERIAVAADGFVAAKPSSVDTASAGAVALVGLTALLLVEALQLQHGETVLVVGANGGVGCLAVQLAARAGARVIGVARPEDEELVRGLGAAEVIGRDAEPPAMLDGVIDTASFSAEDFERWAAGLRPGGRGSSPVGAAGDADGRSNVLAVSSVDNMRRFAAILEEGSLQVPIQQTYELADATTALQDLNTKHTQGKRAIRV
jgi:NADPH:quinone reductase-like Zn-dependent oxidoreductase